MTATNFPSSSSSQSQDSRGTDDTQYLLPPEAYYSGEWYEREQRELFATTWNLAAYESDLPEPGDYVPVTIGLEPVLLVRGDDQQINGFVNMCRHRGMALMGEAGHTDGNLRCFYHGWEFGTSGVLRRVPQRVGQFSSIDLDEWGLIPLSTAVWDGMIFVNPSGTAPPFEEWLGDYPDYRGPFDVAQLEEVMRLRVPIGCNWKLYIENHIDVLHLWYLHSETLGMYDHANFMHHKVGMHWASDERLRKEDGEPIARDRGLPPITHLPDAERDVLRANLLFPNVPTSSSENLFMTYQVVPTGPTTSSTTSTTSTTTTTTTTTSTTTTTTLPPAGYDYCNTLPTTYYTAGGFGPGNWSAQHYSNRNLNDSPTNATETGLPNVLAEPKDSTSAS
mgnify:CR=1 FL=1